MYFDELERRFRNAVLYRDQYTCIRCKVWDKNSILHVHHIYPKSLYPQFRYRVDFACTLCKKCHETYHFVYLIEECNLESMNQFLNPTRPISEFKSCRLEE